MQYLSVCSGIEAASVAWEPLGWSPVAFSEIEPFPSALLAERYPSVPNWGDMTKFKEWPDAAIDILVGGTPCQSFSVAGLRKGMADPRGNLALTYLAIADRYRPEWLVWENVPGVLSSNGGRDFGAFLGGLAELGYGFAYRVLDAQYVRVDGLERAVPQRRRRVFVVGHLGDWRRAAAVLFERESLSGNPPPRRQAGEGVAPTISSRPTGGGGLGTDFDCDGGLIPEVCGALSDGAHMGGGLNGQDAYTGRVIPVDRGGPDVVATPLTAEAGRTGKGDSAQCVAFAQNSRDELREMEVVGALAAEPGMKQTTYIRKGWAVRRLTPTECERLQGFPDNYTSITFRNKPPADGPRYKALGNSMAVNVMRWIGQRIAHVGDLTSGRAAA